MARWLATVVSIWKVLIGETGRAAPVGGPRADAPQRRGQSRKSNVPITSLATEAVHLVSDDAVWLESAGRLVPQTSVLYLHVSDHDRDFIAGAWEPLAQEIQIRLDRWAADNFGISLDLELVGPVADATIAPGRPEWLTGPEHVERLAQVQRDTIAHRLRQGRLTLQHGDGDTEIRLEAGRRSVLGRGDRNSNGARIGGLYTSSRHLAITVGREGQDLIEDLGSTNGTTVDGVQIAAEIDPVTRRRPPGSPRQLSANAEIAFGRGEDAVRYVYHPPASADGLTRFEPTEAL